MLHLRHKSCYEHQTYILNGHIVFPRLSALFTISAKRMDAYWKEGTYSRGRLLSSPVGNHQAYLSSTRFPHRDINKVTIETGFSCIPTMKKRIGEGRGRLFDILDNGVGAD